MSRISFRRGWLLYVGTMGGGPDSGLAVAGDVLDVEISMESGAVNVSMLNSPHMAYVPGPPTTTVRATVGGPGMKMIRGQPENAALWQALQAWPDQGERTWPPQLRAMAELARRHPEEYHALVKTEAGNDPLRVVRHPWIT